VKALLAESIVQVDNKIILTVGIISIRVLIQKGEEGSSLTFILTLNFHFLWSFDSAAQKFEIYNFSEKLN